MHHVPSMPRWFVRVLAAYYFLRQRKEFRRLEVTTPSTFPRDAGAGKLGCAIDRLPFWWTRFCHPQRVCTTKNPTSDAYRQLHPRLPLFDSITDHLQGFIMPFRVLRTYLKLITVTPNAQS
jgi:hypothetical protein